MLKDFWFLVVLAVTGASFLFTTFSILGLLPYFVVTPFDKLLWAMALPSITFTGGSHLAWMTSTGFLVKDR